ncbi:MAG: LL-diaminopimelate aminotransferase [Clostridia bacterium]|jgi:LL-diaminopimelate aminotransferase|nr:LL-diaminopimelate aminotransferase [Clostridia bacterium]MCI8944950.1 LL-diaminopimelate aminotransferase [Clostridia bacterium]MCI9290894.1 LL-diaminopimelate aminotransferase [Clostridia bacterium]
MKINGNFLNLKDSYLFSTVAKKIKEFQSANPGVKVYRLGIGDVTLPLVPAVIEAMHKAVDEMGRKETFRGYGPEQGHDFLRDAIANYYADKKVKISSDEIFISDGAKSDLGNILDILDPSDKVLIPDPVYPAYVDTNIMAGRKIDTALGNQANSFKPMPDENYKADIIYICSPNNPTGSVYNYEELKAWVDYANRQKALIIFDCAYEAFVGDESLPTSIFQIEGARTCAIEFCSFSKTAGFTGTRCGYTVVPQELVFDGVKVNSLWNRRQCTKFNGVPYIVQRGAEAVFSKEGNRQIRENIAYYKENARIIHEALEKKGIWHIGGVNSPYIWLKCPDGMTSWEYFDHLLTKAHVVGTPGAGFGEMGEGYFRLTAFGDRETTQEAVKRILEFS